MRTGLRTSHLHAQRQRTQPRSPRPRSPALRAHPCLSSGAWRCSGMSGRGDAGLLCRPPLPAQRGRRIYLWGQFWSLPTGARLGPGESGAGVCVRTRGKGAGSQWSAAGATGQGRDLRGEIPCWLSAWSSCICIRGILEWKGPSWDSRLVSLRLVWKSPDLFLCYYYYFN